MVTLKQHDNIERQLCAHAVMWTRMLEAGSAWGHTTRIKNNMISKTSPVAPLYGLRKDHKASTDAGGPPVRPVCGASDSLNMKLSHILTTLLDPVWKSPNNSTSCMSTEELVAEIEKVNASSECEPLVVGSVDVKALYPSLDISFTIEKVCEMFQESGVNVEGMDYDEVGLYLSLNISKERRIQLGVDEVCPSPEGVVPSFVKNGMIEDRGKRFQMWRLPDKEPTANQKRKMLTECIRIALTIVMENHMYTFDNKIRKQTSGGAIGLTLTGTLAQIFMMWWDGEFIKRAEDAGIVLRMYKRYVDDIDPVMLETPLGAELKDGKIIVEEARIATDMNIAADARAMRLVKLIGEGIHDSIKLETEYPSKHDDGKMPTLDLKIWVESSTKKIEYEHYAKPVASKFTVHQRSAMCIKSKRQILTQEGLRILLNCSRRLPWEVKAGHLQTFAKRMQFSGYGIKFVREVIKSAVNAYEKMEKNDRDGTRPMYRERVWQWEDRQKKKRNDKINWYKKGGYQSVVFVPATPGSALVKRFKEEVAKSKYKIRVVELSGRTLKSKLQRSDPFKPSVCARDGCAICNTGGKGSCDKNGITYEIKCSCSATYVGQSSRNMYQRGKEHFSGLNNKNGPLWNHCVEQHGSERQEFVCSTTGQYRNDTMQRQIAEAVRIRRSKVPLMNRKDEWNQIILPRATTAV